MSKQVALDLLKELATLGVKLSAQEGQLAIDAPKGVLNPERVTRIRAYKSQLLELLNPVAAAETVSNPQEALVAGYAENHPGFALSFAQQRFWLLHQLQPNSPQYHIHLALECTGKLQLHALNTAFRALLERHQILRTIYTSPADIHSEHEPESLPETAAIQFNTEVHHLQTQLVHLATDLSLPQLDLRHHAHPQAAAQQAALELARQSFNLAQEIPARALLILLPSADASSLADENQTNIEALANKPSLANSGNVQRGNYQLHFCFHHIAVDAWSLQILVQEFSQLYQHHCTAQTTNSPPLQALSLSHADFAAWQQQRLQHGELDTQLSYWQQQLQDLPPRHELPLDFIRPEIEQANAGILRQTIDGPLLPRLKQLAQERGVSLFMLLHSVLAMVLHGYSGAQDIVVGTAIAGRSQRVLEGLVGCLVNSLVLRSQVQGSMPFSTLLAQIRATTLAAFQHQELPFERLVEALQPPRQLGINPLFQICFTWQTLGPITAPSSQSTTNNADPSGAASLASATLLDLPELQMRPLPPGPGAPKFDLDIAVMESSGQLKLGWEFHAGIFAEASVERWMDSFAAVLSALADDPERSVSELLCTLGPPQQQTLDSLGGTLAGAQAAHSTTAQVDTESVPTRALHHYFHQQAQQRPHALALVAEEESGEQRWTYAQLEAQCNRLAQNLRRLCRAGPGQRIALLLPRGAARVISILAVWKSGAAYVPLDPAHPPTRLAEILTDVAPIALIHGGQALDPAPSCAQFSFQQWCQAAEREPNSPPAEDFHPQQLAYVMYTSGSTGTPKGVMVSHANLNYFQQAFHQLLQDNGVDLHSTRAWNAAYTFDVSLEAIASLCRGAPLAVVPTAARTDPQALAQFLQRHQARVMDITPSQLEPLLGPGERSPAPVLIVAGEEIRPALWRRLAQAKVPAWATSTPDTPTPACVFNAYGPTEATVLVAALRIRSQQATQLGAPFPGLTFVIVDAQGGRLPPGAVGELLISGPALAQGYWQRPELTAERFIVGPQGGRYYRTGDRVRWRADGSLEYLGRLDQQLKLRGYRIEAGDIVTALQALPGVTQATVQLRTLGRAEAAGPALVAYYVSQRPWTQTELLEQLSQRLPAYMLPTALVALPRLPLNRSGKLDLHALPEPQLGPTQYQEPSNPDEAELCRLFAQLLGQQRVDPRSDFFSLGGHSLLAIRLNAAIQQQWGVKLSLRQVFEAPSPRALTRCLSKLSQSTESTADDQQVIAATASPDQTQYDNAKPAPNNAEVASPAPNSERAIESDTLPELAQHAAIERKTDPTRVPLSYAQGRFWLLQALSPEDSRYHLPLALELRGPLDLCALQGALDTLLARHEVLRTRYPAQLDQQDSAQAHHGLHAEVLALAHWPLKYWDLPASAQLAGISNAEQLRQLSQNFNQLPFQLSHDLPIRAALVHIAPEHHQLYLVFHHIAVDGWSLGILLHEFSALYPAWCQLGAERALAAPSSPARTPISPRLAGTLEVYEAHCQYDYTSEYDRKTALALAGLAPLPARYRDFARWQQDNLGAAWLPGQAHTHRANTDSDLSYWRQQLAGAPTLHSLALDFPRQSPGLALSLHRELEASSYNALRQRCQRQGASLFMGLQTLLAAVVLRFSGAPEVVLGAPLSQRQDARWQGVVGCFVNSLALRHRFSLDEDFDHALAATREQCLAAFNHQQLPFEALVEALQLPRQAHANPLFQIMLDVVEHHELPPAFAASGHSEDSTSTEIGELKLLPLSSPAQTSKMDLQLSAEESNGLLKLRWNYASALFLNASVARLADAFEQLIQGVLKQPQRSLADLLQALPQDLPYARPPALPLRPFQGLHQRLRQSARQFPQRLALIEELASRASTALADHSEHGKSEDIDSTTNPVAQLIARRLARPRHQIEDPAENGATQHSDEAQVKRWSFAQLDEVTDQLAWSLRQEHQVAAGDRVALLLPRGANQIFSILALWKCGAAYIPLDPQHPPERLLAILNDVAPRLLLVDEAWAAQQELALIEALEMVPLGGIQGLLRQARAARPRVALAAILDAANGVQAHSLAYIIYTSGSTGRAKGVMVNHGNLDYFQERFNALQRQLGLAPQAVRGWNAAYSFDVSLEGIASLCNGSPLAILPQAARQDTAVLARFVASHGVAYIDFTPSHLEALLAADEQLPVPCIVLAGEPIHPHLWQRLAQFNREGARVVNAYGPTETTVIMTATLIDGDPLAHIGPPFSGLPCYIVDEQDRLLPAGAVGELLIGGACVTSGYWRRPSLSARYYPSDGFSGARGQRLYRSGDRARWRPDGSLECLGRVDQQVKIQGYRVELEEIEQALLKQTPALAAAVRIQGEAGQEQLLAYLVLPAAAAPHEDVTTPPPDAQRPSAPQAIDPALSQAWRQALAQQLPHYMLPQQFFQLAQLPLTHNGKLDRSALPVPQPRSASARGPTERLEQQLHRLWCHALGLAEVARDDDFYALGGDSMRSIQLVHQARRQGLHFSVEDLLQQRSIAALAQHLRHHPGPLQAPQPSFADTRLALAATRLSPDLSPDEEAALFPSTAMQRWMWQAYQADPVSLSGTQQQRRGVFHVQHAYRLRAIRFQEKHFRQALEWVLQNPNFRLYFRPDPHARRNTPEQALDYCWQGLHDEAVLDYRYHRWQGLDERAWREQLDHLHAQDRQRPFQPHGALARFDLAQLSADEWILLFSHHHAIMDGWSHGLFFQQIWQALEQCQAGQALPPQRRPLDLSRYAYQERQWASDPHLEEYWRNRLARWPRTPQDLPQGPLEEASAHLDGPLAVRLEVWCRNQRITPKALFLQAWRQALTALGKVGLGLVNHQRNPALEDPLGSLGLFWSLVPLVGETPVLSQTPLAGATAAVALRELQSQLDEISQLGRFPLDRLQALAGNTTLFQASYNFVHFHHLAAQSFRPTNAAKQNAAVNTPEAAAPESATPEASTPLAQLRFSTLRRHDDFGLPWQCFVSASPQQNHYLLSVAVATSIGTDAKVDAEAQRATAVQARQLLHNMLSALHSWTTPVQDGQHG